MMQAQPQDPTSALSELLKERLLDIHTVAEPGWWPPAPGWWVLAVLSLAVLSLGAVRLYRRLRVQLRRRRLLRQLEQIEARFDPVRRPADYLSALNRVFRAIALRAFPSSGCARLEGQAWVAFIQSRMPAAADREALSALESGPYRPRPEFDAVALSGCARQWILHYG